MSGRRSTLVVFARAPELGRVKTRLAAELGLPGALAAYRRLAEHVIAAVKGGERYSLTVAYTPAEAKWEMRRWLGSSVSLTAQSEGSLGNRMGHAIADALANGAKRVVVIGTDCPDVSAAMVGEAFARLADADIVLGPATDGGYYLIGMSRLHPSVFDGVPWSTPETLRVTLERAREAGLSVALLDERRDIDTADDWRAWLASGAHASGRAR